MNNKIFIVVLLLSLACIVSCTKETGSSSFDGIFNKLRDVKTFDDCKKYYTAETISAIEDAAQKGLLSKNEKLAILPKFSQEARWKELSRNISGNDGSITLQYIQHPVENMVGLKMDFRLKKVRGYWKIDIADEIRTALAGRKSGSAEKYLEDIRKGR